MPDVSELLEICKNLAGSVGQKILQDARTDIKSYVHSDVHLREVKAVADTVLEEVILSVINPLGLPVLTEESGYLAAPQESEFLFVIDPLDGTFNFVKGLGPCVVSIALWRNNQPVFGVIYDLVLQQLVWGGDGIGAYCDSDVISVSSTASKATASICTGFPVRFDTENDRLLGDFGTLVNQFGKVRMFGSAAASLVCVAKGSADYYAETDIMLWDVAAGLAIVEGAGGAIQYSRGNFDYSLDVRASNRILLNLY